MRARLPLPRRTQESTKPLTPTRLAPQPLSWVPKRPVRKWMRVCRRTRSSVHTVLRATREGAAPTSEPRVLDSLVLHPPTEIDTFVNLRHGERLVKPALLDL